MKMIFWSKKALSIVTREKEQAATRMITKRVVISHPLIDDDDADRAHLTIFERPLSHTLFVSYVSDGLSHVLYIRTRLCVTRALPRVLDSANNKSDTVCMLHTYTHRERTFHY
jgi:hypothetical protein